MLKELKTRLWWLSIGLALSIGIAQVIKLFEDVLIENIVLATFIPLIVYTTDAAKTQMEDIIIREESGPRKFNFNLFLTKQTEVIIPISIIISAIAFVIIYLLEHQVMLAAVIGVSLFIGILSSILTGVFIPYWFWRLHKDPAEASGPIATVVQDAFSVVIFFAVAQLLL